MGKLASNNNKALGPWTSVPFSPKLGYYYNGTKWYYPLVLPTSVLTWGGYKYSYDKSVGDTFGVALNGTKYVVPNKRVSAAYDIPAGTYSPSAFKKLIESFISHNGSRAVKNNVSVTVNGQTVSILAGAKIYYTTQGSSPWYAKAVCFGTSYFMVASCVDKVGFSSYKSYIVETSKSNSYPNSYCFNYVFRYYESFNITVETGIKFK